MMPISSQTLASDQVLNSWKEIAGYMDRGVRTVQRWESELGLPVRRPRGRSRSAVVAMRSELDEWLRLCPLAAGDQVDLKIIDEDGSTSDTKNVNGSWMEERIVSPRLGELVLRSRLLRHEIDHSREQWQGALHRLIGSIQRLAQPDGDSSSVEEARVA